MLDLCKGKCLKCARAPTLSTILRFSSTFSAKSSSAAGLDAMTKANPALLHPHDMD